MKLRFSAQEVREGIVRFLSEYIGRAGDDIATLSADISTDLWGDGGTADPAAWFDWTRSLWSVRGVRAPVPLGVQRDPRPVVSLADGTQLEVLISATDDSEWNRAISSVDSERGGYTERQGLELLSRLLDSYSERSGRSLIELQEGLWSEKVDNPVLATWNELSSEGPTLR